MLPWQPITRLCASCMHYIKRVELEKDKYRLNHLICVVWCVNMVLVLSVSKDPGCCSICLFTLSPLYLPPSFLCMELWCCTCSPLTSAVLTHSPVLTQLSQSEQETTPRHKQEVLISDLLSPSFSPSHHLSNLFIWDVFQIDSLEYCW